MNVSKHQSLVHLLDKYNSVKKSRYAKLEGKRAFFK